MRLPSLRDPDEFIEVPRWLPTLADQRPLDGKRVLAKAGYGHSHFLEIGYFRTYGPNAEGCFAVDISFPCPGSVTSLKAYVYHLSPAQLARLVPCENPEYEFVYDGVLNADHPFTSSFTGLSEEVYAVAGSQAIPVQASGGSQYMTAR